MALNQKMRLLSLSLSQFLSPSISLLLFQSLFLQLKDGEIREKKRKQESERERPWNRKWREKEESVMINFHRSFQPSTLPPSFSFFSFFLVIDRTLREEENLVLIKQGTVLELLTQYQVQAQTLERLSLSPFLYDILSYEKFWNQKVSKISSEYPQISLKFSSKYCHPSSLTI